MEQPSQFSQLTKRLGRIPTTVWFLGFGLVAALVALLVFKVAVGTVVSYSFFTLMMGSHFFMHGSHGGHAGAGQPGHPTEAIRSNKDQSTGRSGGCH